MFAQSPLLAEQSRRCSLESRRAAHPPMRLSNLDAFACCCASGNCSPMAFRLHSARAFDVLLLLLEADGSLVTKEELLGRVWPGIMVVEENLKFQICALRKALGAERDLIRTEVGRGYRFTGVLGAQSTASHCYPMPPKPPPRRVFFPNSCRYALQSSVNSEPVY
jgi:hypothetical protein